MGTPQAGLYVTTYTRCASYGVFTLAWAGTKPGQGPGRASINQWKHFQDLKNGYQIHSSGPENVPSVLIKKILPGPGPDSGPSQCEYTIIPALMNP